MEINPLTVAFLKALVLMPTTDLTPKKWTPG